jgi:hypothetical protein
VNAPLVGRNSPVYLIDRAPPIVGIKADDTRANWDVQKGFQPMQYKFEHQIQYERFPVQSKDVRRFIFSVYGKLACRIVVGQELQALLRMDKVANVWAAEHLAIATNSRADFYEKSFPAGVLRFAAAEEEISPIHDSTIWAGTLWISVNLDPDLWLEYGYNQGTEAYPLPHAWIECKTSDIEVMQKFKAILGKYGNPWPDMKARPIWEQMM